MSIIKLKVQAQKSPKEPILGPRHLTAQPYNLRSMPWTHTVGGGNCP